MDTQNPHKQGYSEVIMHQAEFIVFHEHVSISLIGVWIKLYLFVIVIQTPASTLGQKKTDD